MGLFSKALKGAARAMFKGEPQLRASYKDVSVSNPFQQYYAVPLEIKDGYVKYDYIEHHEGMSHAKWHGYRYSSVEEFNFFFEFHNPPVEKREEDQIPF